MLMNYPKLFQNKIVMILVLSFLVVAAFSLSILIRQEQSLKSVPMVEKKDGVIEMKKALVDGAPVFPIFPDSAIHKSYKKTVDEKMEFLVIYEVDEEVPVIVSWYNKNAAVSGWTVVQNSDFPDAKDEQILLLRNNKYNLTLVVKDNETDGKTLISTEFLPL